MGRRSEGFPAPSGYSTSERSGVFILGLWHPTSGALGKGVGNAAWPWESALMAWPDRKAAPAPLGSRGAHVPESCWRGVHSTPPNHRCPCLSIPCPAAPLLGLVLAPGGAVRCILGILGLQIPTHGLRVRALAPAQLPGAQEAWGWKDTGLAAPLAGAPGNHAEGTLGLLVAWSPRTH